MVVGGFCERGPDGRVFNSSALVDGGGVRAVYRKLHLWADESRWFDAGDQPAPVVETRYGRIGLGVCYDIEFPELTRGLALAGADLIALPANWPRDPRPPDGRPVLHSLAAMTAYLNRVYRGRVRPVRHGAGPRVRGRQRDRGPRRRAPRRPGRRTAGTATLIADCDLADARDKRTGERNDAFADRRPAHYAPSLAAPNRP